MSKVEGFLAECKKNIGKWTCSLHTTGSNQPAAIFREAKKLGYEFEEVSANRWAKTSFCPVCGQDTTHYKLLSVNPTLTKQVRLTIDKKSRERTLRILGGTDAFTGASISSTPEIDHKVPWTRLDEDIDIRNLTDSEIKEHFQLLTREHNLLKDRMCAKCKICSQRPPFFGINFWYKGDSIYRGSCVGCGYYDGNAWREAANKILENLTYESE